MHFVSNVVDLVNAIRPDVDLGTIRLIVPELSKVLNSNTLKNLVRIVKDIAVFQLETSSSEDPECNLQLMGDNWLTFVDQLNNFGKDKLGGQELDDVCGYFKPCCHALIEHAYGDIARNKL